MILWPVAKRPRPRQTQRGSESPFCLLAQVFRDTATAGCGVWGRMAHLSLSAVLPGPSWTLQLSLWPRASPRPSKASGVRSGLPDCAGPGLSLEFLLLLCRGSSPSSPAHPSPQKLGLHAHFELSLVSTSHFLRRPELLLINPQTAAPPPESTALPGRTSRAQPIPKLTLPALAEVPQVLHGQEHEVPVHR